MTSKKRGKGRSDTTIPRRSQHQNRTEAMSRPAFSTVESNSTTLSPPQANLASHAPYSAAPWFGFAITTMTARPQPAQVPTGPKRKEHTITRREWEVRHDENACYNCGGRGHWQKRCKEMVEGAVKAKAKEERGSPAAQVKRSDGKQRGGVKQMKVKEEQPLPVSAKPDLTASRSGSSRDKIRKPPEMKKLVREGRWIEARYLEQGTDLLPGDLRSGRLLGSWMDIQMPESSSAGSSEIVMGEDGMASQDSSLTGKDVEETWGRYGETRGGCEIAGGDFENERRDLEGAREQCGILHDCLDDEDEDGGMMVFKGRNKG